MANENSGSFTHIQTKDIRLLPFSNDDIGYNDDNVQLGTIRYNKLNNSYEGYLSMNETNGWAEFNLRKASPTILGGVSIGSNLYSDINGKISSFAYGISQIDQNIITVSKTTHTQSSDIVTPSFDTNTNFTITNPPSSYSSSDFNTINQAINYINNLPTNKKPSATNPYIIKISPGSYPEQVFLTTDGTIFGNQLDYVSIVGSGIDKTIIDMPDIFTQNATIYNIFILGKYNFIENLTIKNTHINNNGVTNYIGIKCGKDPIGTDIISQLGPIYINNINIEIGNITTENIGIYTQYCHVITNKTNINLLELSNTKNTNYGIKSDKYSKLLVNNCDITIDRTGTNNYGIHSIDNNNLEIKDSSIIISGFADNYGIYISNTYYKINKSKIIASNYINYQSYGITNISNNGYVLNPIDIRFDSKSNRDIITLNTSGSLQFNNLRNNQLINIEILNDITHTNNKIIKLYSVEVSEESSQLSIYDKLVINTNYSVETYPTDISTFSSCKIKGYYIADIQFSNITGGTNAIHNSNYYYINNVSSQFNEGPLLLNDGIFSSTYYSVITVGNEKADFLFVSTAIQSILDASASRRYLIKVFPGTYNEPNIIQMKRYVDIVGV